MTAATYRRGNGVSPWSLARHRLATLATGVLHHGPAGAAHLLRLYLLEPCVAAAEQRWAAFWRDLLRRAEPRLAARRIARLERARRAIIDRGRRGYRIGTGDLPLSDELRRALARARPAREVPLASIDQDGYFVWRLGPIEGYPELPAGEALPRRRTDITLVDLDGTAAIRKDYRGDRVSFANEVEALDELGEAGLRVPSIVDIDVRALVLYTSFIPGTVVREELARRGADLRDRDDPGTGLHPREIRRRRAQEGRRKLLEVMSPAQIESLVDQVRRVHELGFTCLDVKYGNVVLEASSGEPYLIDFGDLRRIAGVGRWGRAALRDVDIEAVNEHFGTELPTRSRLERRLEAAAGARVYAPVYFGAGLRLGSIWSDEAGYGRWLRLLNRHMPDVRGRRVLEVGANNGANALEMLRRGAREVVAVELEQRNIDQGKLVRDGVEWADNRRYPLTFVRADMRELPSMPLGSFDLVVALCCLYYVDDAEMARLVRHFRSLSPVLVVQCNTAQGIGRRDADVYRRASVEHNLGLLRDNGFPHCKVIAPPRYARPLIVATA